MAGSSLNREDREQYEVFFDSMVEIKLVDYSDKQCKKCYGRGHTGILNNRFDVCRCVKRNYTKEQKKRLQKTDKKIGNTNNI